MSFFLLVTLLAATGGLTLASVALLRGSKSISNCSFAAGLVFLVLEEVMASLSYQATDAGKMRFWQIARLQAMAWLPFLWLVFSLSFSRGNYREFLRLWRTLLILALVLPPSLALIFRDYLVQMLRNSDSGGLEIAFAPAGKVLLVLFLLGLVLVLVNLERTFRSAVGTMRWRVKYAIIGLFSLFAFRIYATSQAIIYPTIDPRLWQLNSLALLIACALLAYSFARAEFASVDLYPSKTVLYHSFTLLLSGVYLLLVGLLAKVVSFFGGDAYFSLKAFLVMIGLVGLAAVLLSERLRQSINAFVNRHFKRPAHDYREIWSNFSDKTAAVISETLFCQLVVKWVSEALQALSASLWLFDARQERVFLAASTSLSGVVPANAGLSPEIVSALATRLAGQVQPVNLMECRDSWGEVVRSLNPRQFQGAREQWCLPVLHRQELLGLLILGDRVNGLPFTSEDLHLVKCLGIQVAGHLANIRLSNKMLEVKEFEAFQTMSAFFVHDLKNTASTLSLLLKNFREHAEDPAFREDAFRAIAKSAQRLQDLIHRLNQLRQELRLVPSQVDLNDVVKAAAASCHDPSRSIEWIEDLAPVPKALLDAEQVQKVVTNLLLNAVESLSGQGWIRMKTRPSGHWLVLSVADNGCGMSPEFMDQRLFKPFHTTKKTGLGIGMFHSKLIVDAHRGRIEVNSEVGKGSEFRVWLPVSGLASTDTSSPRK